jgi:hypothetical protein
LKQGTGISASLAAILSSVATMSCCLPLGFAAALSFETIREGPVQRSRTNKVFHLEVSCTELVDGQPNAR